MTMFLWSKTAATNATADSTINYAEGQAPSTVNDSARAAMAAVAKYRDDTSGKLVTAGTSTVYTLATNQVFTTLAAMDGQSLTFKMHVLSGAAPTLNVDGLGAKALNGISGTAVLTGALVLNAIYEATYDNAGNQWIMTNTPGQFAGNPVTSFPAGTVMLFGLAAAPTGWTKSVVHNNKALRLVSGATGSGGTTAFTTVFANRTLIQSNLPNVTLGTGGTINAPSISGTVALAPFLGAASASAQQFSGGTPVSVYPTSSILQMDAPNFSITTSSINGGTGQTSIDFAVQFVDVILATKD